MVKIFKCFLLEFKRLILHFQSLVDLATSHTLPKGSLFGVTHTYIHTYMTLLYLEAARRRDFFYLLHVNNGNRHFHLDFLNDKTKLERGNETKIPEWKEMKTTLVNGTRAKVFQNLPKHQSIFKSDDRSINFY